MTVNPDKHAAHFPQFKAQLEVAAPGDDSENETMAPSIRRKRQGVGRRWPRVGVAVLSDNEIIGDMESLLQLERYCYAVVCARPTQLYEISVHQWTKLLQLRQNQQYAVMMMKRLQLRMSSRLARPAAPQVPLFNILLKRIGQHIQDSENEARQLEKEAERVLSLKDSKRTPTLAEQYSRFIPAQGALVDQYGPGTAFHHFKQQRRRRENTLDEIPTERKTLDTTAEASATPPPPPPPTEASASTAAATTTEGAVNTH